MLTSQRSFGHSDTCDLAVANIIITLVEYRIVSNVSLSILEVEIQSRHTFVSCWQASLVVYNGLLSFICLMLSLLWLSLILLCLT